MPWSKAARLRRERIEDLDAVTTPVPILKDCWVKLRLVLTHVAGIASLVSTLVTESAYTRAAVDRMQEQMLALREEIRERGQ